MAPGWAGMPLAGVMIRVWGAPGPQSFTAATVRVPGPEPTVKVGAFVVALAVMLQPVPVTLH